MSVYVFSMAPYRIKSLDADKVHNATQYSQSMGYFLKRIFIKENKVLIDLPEWGRESPASTEKTEESEVNNNLFNSVLAVNYCYIIVYKLCC